MPEPSTPGRATLIYSLGLDQWDCPTHGTMWSGPALAISRGFATSDDFIEEPRDA